MATLYSAGVDVEIIDETMGIGAQPGTIPLFIIATAANKSLPSGSTGTASYSTSSKAGQVYLSTSQRDLMQAYGVFSFQNAEGTPLHGDERNEYGLQAAYSYLGVANRAYILRADIDLNELTPSNIAPVGAPTVGTYWFDIAASSFGLFQANGNSFPGSAWSNQRVLVVAGDNAVLTSGGHYAPSPSFGYDGNFAIVIVSSDNRFYQRISGAWYEINTPAWFAKFPTTVVGTATANVVALGSSFMINGVTVAVNAGGAISDVVWAVNSANIPHITAAISANNALEIINSTGSQVIVSDVVGTPLETLGISAGTYNGVSVYRTSDAQWPDGSAAGSIWIKGTKPNHGANWNFKFFGSTATWITLPAPLYPYTSSLADGIATKDSAAYAALGVPTAGTIYIAYDAAQGNQTPRIFNGSQWNDLSYEASAATPFTPPPSGTHWYSTDFQVDVMVGNGMNWNGYRRRFPLTDPAGVILDGSKPTTQTNGQPLVDNDLWIDTTDLDHYPAMYRYTADTMSWTSVDNADSTTPFGIVFADARQDSGPNFAGCPNVGHYSNNSGSITDLLISDYADPDAPDARTFPSGVILFNTRYSTYNVKKWIPNYFSHGADTFSPNEDFTMNTYNIGGFTYEFSSVADAGRWVTASGNKVDGSPYMGRFAQRAMVVRALAAVIMSNQDIRSEMIYYNLLTCPGYVEVLSELVQLNTDQKEFSFIVADTPARLAPNSNAIQNWANNLADVASDDEYGLITASPYIGIYYPWGYTQDLSGNDIFVAPSTIAMNTIAYSDSVSYPWFPPAGFHRGLVSNASSVGYLKNGHYTPMILNQGQRDTLYINNINPFAFIPGRGLVVYGQKTREPLSGSALSRINVARLCNYVKYNLDTMLKVFLFELNDTHTRTAAKALVDGFFAGLVTSRAIYDYLTVVDLTNNTPERIDANELWIDALIKPERSVEFIYVPVRLENTGANLATVASSLGI